MTELGELMESCRRRSHMRREGIPQAQMEIPVASEVRLIPSEPAVEFPPVVYVALWSTPLDDEILWASAEEALEEFRRTTTLFPRLFPPGVWIV